MPSHAKSGGRAKLPIDARRTKVAEYLMRRWTYREIADELGVSLPTIVSDVKALRQQWAEVQAEGREVLVTRELQHIDSLERQLMLDYFNATTSERPAYMARMTALLDKRTKLLGLDQAPGKNIYGQADPEEWHTREPIRLEVHVVQPGNKVEPDPADEPDEDEDDLD